MQRKVNEKFQPMTDEEIEMEQMVAKYEEMGMAGSLMSRDDAMNEALGMPGAAEAEDEHHVDEEEVHDSSTDKLQATGTLEIDRLKNVWNRLLALDPEVVQPLGLVLLLNLLLVHYLFPHDDNDVKLECAQNVERAGSEVEVGKSAKDE